MTQDISNKASTPSSSNSSSSLARLQLPKKFNSNGSSYDAGHMSPSSMSRDNSLGVPSSTSEDDDESLISGSDQIIESAVAEAAEESRLPKTQSSLHGIFPALFPFSNSSNNGTNSIFASLLPGDSKEELQRNLIKEKLKKNQELTHLEEEFLYSDESGADNVRKRAVKKTFQLESLKHAIHSIKALRGATTNDGYDYHRVATIWDELDGDILVMGGYRGSILRDKSTGRRVWMPIKAGLNLRKIDLRIGPSDQDELNEINHYYPDGILSHVGPVDICRRLLKKLNSNPNVRVTNFGYDWRISLDIPAKQLCEKLQQLYDTQKIKKGTIIVAHSMGGIVAHKALQECSHLIRGIVYVGVPSQSPNILGPLKFGDEILMNKTILSKEANFLMRSSFVFLPLDGYCFMEKNTYKKYKLDYFDTKVWIKLGLSPLVDEDRYLKCEPERTSSPDPTEQSQNEIENEKQMAQTDTKKSLPGPGIPTDSKDLLGILNPIPVIRSLSENQTGESSSDLKQTLNHLNPITLVTKLSSPSTTPADASESKAMRNEQTDVLFKTPYDECVKYLEKTLKRTKAFLLTLQYDPKKSYPPLVMVYGNQVPTVKGAHVNGLKDVKLGNYEDFCYAPGDGVVYHKWLLPEHRGFPVAAKIASNCGHVSLMSDLNSMAKAFISILDNDKYN